MELKEFIKETLLDVANGIEEANSELKSINSFVAGDNIKRIGEETIKIAMGADGQEHLISDIKFDIAVTISESGKKEGGGHISVLPIKIGGKLQNENLSTVTSKLQFSIPLALPFKPVADYE